MQFTYVVELI